MRETGAGAASSAGREGRIRGRTVAGSCKNQMQDFVRMEVRLVQAAWFAKLLRRSKGSAGRDAGRGSRTLLIVTENSCREALVRVVMRSGAPHSRSHRRFGYKSWRQRSFLRVRVRAGWPHIPDFCTN